MSISRPFIERPIATTLIMAALFVFGAVAYDLLAVAPLPQVDFPTIQVTASLPGASPETMAATVAQPLERQFSTIPGVAQLTSTSATGNTSITIQFDLDRNIDGAAGDVQAAINAAGGQLPAALPNPPNYRKVNPADSPILVLGLSSEVLPISEVNEYADNNIAQRLSLIGGVGQVIIAGAQKPAVHVQADPQALAARGIGFDELASAISANNVEQPTGTLQGDSRAYLLDANGQIAKAEGYKNIIVAYRNGRAVQVQDVARVLDGVEQPLVAGWVNQKRGIILVVLRQPGANLVETVDKVKAALPQLSASIPPSIKVDEISDRSLSVRASLGDVQKTLIETIILVVIVIALFLRSLRATIIPSIAVPLSIVGTFAVMYLLGYTLDNLSLMGLTLAVGLVVDDAIVMLENIVRYVEDGMDPMAAAFKGASEVGFTIISITVSLIAVFIPLLFMGGVVGRLFREFSVTVTVAIVMSAIISVTLTPMLCSRFLKHDANARHGRVYTALEKGFDALLAGYRRTLRLALKARWLMLALTVGLVWLTVHLFAVVPKGLFPQEDIGLAFAFTEAAQDISFPAMYERQEAVLKVIGEDPAIFSFGAFIGAGGASTVSNTGRIFIQLVPRSQRDVTIQQVIQRLRPKLAQLPGINTFLQARQSIEIGGRLSRTQYQYTVQDVDVDELNTWAPRLEQKLKSLPILQDVASDSQLASPQLVVDVDRVAAGRLGLTPSQIENTLYNAFGQRFISQIYTQLNTYRVILEVAPEYQRDPSALDRIYVRSSAGELVPISTFAKIVPRLTSLSVNHQGQFPAVTLSFNLAPGASLSQAVERIRVAEREIQLPASIQTSFQGTAQEFQRSLVTLPLLIAAAIFAVYIVLGILYESFIHPITILSSLPPAGVGALVALDLLKFDLSVIAVIGLILLIGIVKKNGIMMIDFALHAERERGLPPEQAIYEACLLRFRPIMMTTMAALVGALPIAFGAGAGAELRQPLGVAVVGGLLVSQFVTLYTTPVIYLFLERASLYGRSLLTRRATPEPAGRPRPIRAEEGGIAD